MIKLALLAGLAFWCNAASLADFTKCLSPQGQGSVCQLDTGVYQLSTPLAIGRSNITIKGTILKSLADTTLQRAPGSARALMAAYDQTPNLSSITVRDFTFDGGGPPTGQIESDLRLIAVKSLLVTNCALINSQHAALQLEGTPDNGYTSGAVLNNISIESPAYYAVLALTTDEDAGTYFTCGSRDMSRIS